MKNAILTKLPFAHRGLHGENVPENSLLAFTRAIEAGYAIETDVRLTKDGALPLFHDGSLARLCKIEKEVYDCTEAQLRSLTLAGSAEKIPFFDELLKRVNGRVPLLIEIKEVKGANKKEYVKRISDALKNYEGEYAVQSFHPFLVKEYKRLNPEIPCGILACANGSKRDFDGSLFWRIKAYLVKHLSFNRTIKPDFISYRAEDLPRPETERFEGVTLAWTVRSYASEQIFRNYCDNIIFENYLPNFTK